MKLGDPGLGTKVGTIRRQRLLCPRKQSFARIDFDSVSTSANDPKRPLVISPYNGSKWYGYGANSMSKERKTNKEVKKKPTMTPKERKAVKKSRKEGMESQYR